MLYDAAPLSFCVYCTNSGLPGLLRHLVDTIVPNPWDALSGSTREGSFISKLEEHWINTQKFPNFCIVLQGIYPFKKLRRFPHACENWTVGAHIVPHSCQGELFGRVKRFLEVSWDSTDEACNGLPLCKVLEVAFDKLQLCFIYDPGQESWVVRVLDDSLKGVITLTDRNNHRTNFQPEDLTWERVNGTAVKIAEIVSRRALVFHAYWCAKNHCKEISLCMDDVHTVSKRWIKDSLSEMEPPPLGPDPALE